MSTTQVQGIKIHDDEQLLHSVDGGSRLAECLQPTDLVIGLITGFLWTAYVYLTADGRSQYVVTDERVVIKSGGLSSSIEQISFDDIVGDIETEQTVAQSLLDIGDVEFQVQKAKETVGTEGVSGDREQSQRSMDITRETVTLKSLDRHQEVYNTIAEINR